MARTPEQESLVHKLETAQPGQLLQFTEPEIKVLRGFARFLLGTGVVFGSFRQVLLFAAVLGGAVAGVNAVIKLLWGVS